ncbi:hypothetical protein K0M31_015368 [Melipona bicolor]|uniref:Uncharacterized protein n=1 Tax=Melipona bicolor TaxID=60889 RepID=A0AA40FFM9_9HYME|nr:hypothetical protein K0M31_015368 [Melipona bicolor]
MRRRRRWGWRRKNRGENVRSQAIAMPREGGWKEDDPKNDEDGCESGDAVGDGD